MRLSAILPGVALIFCCVDAAHAELKLSQRRSIGAWEVSSFVDTGTQRLSFCSILGTPVDRSVFGLRLRADRSWVLSVDTLKADWNGQRDIPFVWRLRDLPQRQARGYDIGEGSANTEPQRSASQLDEFRAGGVIRLSIGGESFEFDLTGIGAAMAEMESCVASGGSSLAAIPATPPRSSPPSSRQAGGDITSAMPGGATETYLAGDWKVSVFVDSKSGDFGACMAMAPASGQAVFGFLLNRRGNLALILAHQDWAWPEKQRQRVTYRIDGLAPREVEASPVRGRALTMALAAAVGVVEEFRDGRSLQASVAGQNHVLPLSGSAAALAELRRCVESRAGLVLPPLRPPPRPAAPSLPNETPSSQR